MHGETIKFDTGVFFLGKPVVKIQCSLNSDNNNWHFIWRPIYIYDYISLSSSSNVKCSRQKL